jgi:hypothetical protein
MAWPKRNAPVVILSAALVASAALLLALERNLTFFQDTWAFLLHRRPFTADAFLEPHNEHIVVIPVALEKLLIAVFGMTSAAPEQVAMTLVLAVTGALVFVYVRRRLGSWPALLAAVLLLFVGPAWEVLLWPFEIALAGSVLFGVATLLALDRGSRRGDLVACLCLVASIGFSSLGIAFVAAAVVDVLQRRRSHGLRRAYLAAVPILLYAAWWAGWGHDAETHLSLHNVLLSPRYVLEGLAASLSSLLGLSAIGLVGKVVWGLPVLLVLLALFARRLVGGFRPSPRLWPVAAATAVYWFLAAFNYIPGREAYASRYMYAGAALALLLAAELLRGVRFGRTALLAAATVSAAAVALNMIPLSDGKDQLREQTVLTRADLAALEIARRSVEPGFALTPEVAGTASLIDVDAGDYLAMVAAHGSPAYTPAELTAAPEAGRRQADVVLAEALPVTTTERPGRRSGAGADCVEATGPSAEVRIGPGVTRIVVPPGPAVPIGLRRFAGVFPVVPEPAPGGETTFVRIPHDASARPWWLHVEPARPVRVCRRAPVQPDKALQTTRPAEAGRVW